MNILEQVQGLDLDPKVVVEDLPAYQALYTELTGAAEAMIAELDNPDPRDPQGKPLDDAAYAQWRYNGRVAYTELDTRRRRLKRSIAVAHRIAYQRQKEIRDPLRADGQRLARQIRAEKQERAEHPDRGEQAMLINRLRQQVTSLECQLEKSRAKQAEYLRRVNAAEGAALPPGKEQVARYRRALYFLVDSLEAADRTGLTEDPDVAWCLAFWEKWKGYGRIPPTPEEVVLYGVPETSD